MENQILSEEFRRMQKLAGIITEEQLNENIEQFEDYVSESDDIVKFLKQNFKKFKYAIDDYFDVDEDFKPNDIVKVNNNSSLAGIKGQTDLDSSFSFDEEHIKSGRSGVDKLKIKINGIMVYGLVGPTYGLKYNE